MTTGVKIKGGGKNYLGWNLFVGTDTAVDIEDSWENILQGNIHISKSALQMYGEGITDIAEMVIKSKDTEALLALGNILNSRSDNDAVLGWMTLARKFGTKIGRFSFSMLSGILSNSAYSYLKIILGQHGIAIP